MGICKRYFPKDMSVKLAQIVEANLFIETGTYMGGTAKWAATEFRKVHTIELSENLFKQTEKELLSIGNIMPHLGDSRSILPKILSNINENIIFWLDGHYSGGITAGEENPCPLLKELEIILHRNKNDIILIDDARLVTGTYGWPTITEIYEIIVKCSVNKKFMLICDDNIYIVPDEDRCKKLLFEYSLQRNILQWEQISEMNYAFEANIKKVKEQIGILSKECYDTVIFGAGKFGTNEAYEYITKILKFDITYFCDNDPKKWGLLYTQDKIKCLSPQELSKKRNQIICFICLLQDRALAEVVHQLMAMKVTHIITITSLSLKIHFPRYLS